MHTRSHDLAKLSALVHASLVFIILWYQYAHSSSLAEQLHLLFCFMFWKCRLNTLCSENSLGCYRFPSPEFAGFEPGRWVLCADHPRIASPIEKLHSLKLHKAKTLSLLFLFYSQQHSLDCLQYQLCSCSTLDTWELQQRVYPSGHWVILCWFLFFSFIFRQFAPPCPPETVLLHSSSSHLFSS